MDDKMDVKVPIKGIIEESLIRRNIEYPDEFILSLRRFYIASLNLGFLEAKNLERAVEKFTSNVKCVYICDSFDKFKVYTTDEINIINYLKDKYIFEKGVLILDYSIISSDAEDENVIINNICTYKAIAQIVFNAPSDLDSFADIITEIAAEKIENMDANGNRIIMPRTVNETVNGKVVCLRAGYQRYNLLINLAKQLFIALNINENMVIKDMMDSDFNSVLEDLNKSNFKRCLILLSGIYKAYLKSNLFNREVDNYLKLIENYQKSVNDLFSHPNQNYFAFCALVTSESLKEELMRKFE